MAHLSAYKRARRVVEIENVLHVRRNIDAWLSFAKTFVQKVNRRDFLAFVRRFHALKKAFSHPRENSVALSIVAVESYFV